tara:strand:+ start:27020 stop:27292 length:273 start_codon:yes stop_codon:yes gene_type:complete
LKERNYQQLSNLAQPAWYSTGLEFSVYTFLGDLELAALGDLDRLDRLVARALGQILDLLHNLVSLQDLTEHDVAAVEPAGDDSGDEELGA